MSVKRGPEKHADNKKSKRKKTRNADGKKIIINKQTNTQLRKEIFLSSRCHMVGPFTYIQIVMPIVGTVLYPVIPFISHRNKDAPFLLLKCTHTWCTSPLSV